MLCGEEGVEDHLSVGMSSPRPEQAWKRPGKDKLQRSGAGGGALFVRGWGGR